MSYRGWIACLVCVISCGDPDSPGDPGSDIADAGVDGPGVDGPGVSACDPSTELANDPDHCGRCDHSCGGAACLQGECQPLELARDLPGLRRIAITDTDLYWTEAQRVATCPLPEGCVRAPRAVAEPFDRLDLLAVQGDAVFFVGCFAGSDTCDDRQRLFECPTSGCPPQPPIHMYSELAFEQLEAGPSHLFLRDDRPEIFRCAVTDCGGTDVRYGLTTFGVEMQSIALDGETLYVDVPGDLRTCPVDAGCAAPGTLPGTGAIDAPFTVRNGLAFWVSAGGPGLPAIHTCAVSSCSVSTFATEVSDGSELEADDTGLYWIDSVAGAIWHCPLSGCPNGGATSVAQDLDGPANLTLGPGFVYFTAGTSIYKVAKP